ncbi:uncharacterized protein M6B38_174570 [Iris pallida]|uniref:Uncharacterized protein n=1 Tax=Iris pallida TaxID=29817 RepID=A0AAX6ER95_IRIPA|nr:uncharacterized protein M6B38_174570 [Iris pallida]
MAIEAKEVVMYIGKGLLFSMKTCYRTVRRHPLVSIVVFLLLILYRTFPSLFAFLVTSSPVILCTALLLGTLLSYGTPNIPHIEEEIKKTQEISSLQVGSAVDDLVTKKDETFTVETHVETSREVDERTVEEAALGEASTSAGNEALRDVPFTMIRDMGYHDDDTLLPAYFAASDMKEISSEKPIAEEREVCGPGLAEKGEFPLEKHPEGGPSEDVGDLGLTVQIANPAPENLFDSSLGSPWQPIDSHEEASDSDSDSSGSSSPDASMADIIPMLDELHPLLDSGHPQATTRATGYSDSASSGSSQDDESDDGSAEEEIERKEDKGKEAVQEERDDSNEEAVPWTAADQKNVMDLGVSELERNRRLESMIAKRRARKLQRFVTEKNLIDLDSYYATPIPSISAPRSNPFDHSYDSFPGSAPSVLQPRHNPFDLPYDQVEKLSSLSRDYLGHHDFVSSPQRDMFSGTNENSTLGPSYSSDLHEESDNSKLKTYSVAERMDSEDIEYTAFQRQLSEETDLKLSSVSESNKVSSVTGQEDYNEQLLEPQVHQSLLPPADIGTEHFKQDSKSFEEVDSVAGENEKSRASAGDDHAINLNTSIVVEETCQPADSFSAVEEEIGEAAANLPLSDAVKDEVVEHKYEESNSSSLEDNEKSSGMGTNEESANLDQTSNDFVQSDRAIDIPGAHPLYDSSPSLSNTSQLVEDLLYEGKEDLISSSLASDGQVDSSEVVSQPKSLEKDPSLKDRDYVEVNGSVGEELASPPLCIASSSVYSVDEAESASREITEIKEQHDSMQTEVSKVSEDVPELASGGTMLSSSFPSVDSESGDVHPIDVDKSTQSEGENIMAVPPPREESVIHPSSEADLEDSQASILDLPSIPEETAEDFKFEDVGEIATKPAVVSSLTGLQVIDDPNLRLRDAEQQPSSDPKSSEDIGGYDDSQYLVPGAENNDVSVVSSIIPTHDGGATGMQSLEPTENREFSTSSKTTSELKTECSNDLIHSEEDPTPSKTTSELEMESNNDSEGEDTGEIQRRGECLEITNNSSEDSDDDIYAGDTEIKEIDEGLLSELDAVGDFE